MKIRLVVTDIEGCLTINKRQPLDMGVLTKLHAYCELARKGRKSPIIVCTGRGQPYVEAIIQILDAFFPNFPSIIENGCYLYDPVEDVIIPNPAILRKEEELVEIMDYLYKKIIFTKTAKKEPGKELCVSLNPFAGMTVENLRDIVQRILPDRMKKLVFITNSSSAVDITPKGVTKGSGLEFLSKRTGIDFSEMIGIGDTAGDFPMLEIVGNPACPSNAKPEVVALVKSRGGYVAKQPNTAGVWEIFLHYNLMR